MQTFSLPLLLLLLLIAMSTQEGKNEYELVTSTSLGMVPAD
jgi:hypothetical protein